MAYEDFWNAFNSIKGYAGDAYNSAGETYDNASNIYDLLSGALPLVGPLVRSGARYMTEPGQMAGPDEPYMQPQIDLSDPRVRESVLSAQTPIKGDMQVKNSRGSFSRSEKPIAAYEEPSVRKGKQALSLEEALQKTMTDNQIKLLKTQLEHEGSQNQIKAEVQKYLADRGFQGTQYSADKELEGTQAQVGANRYATDKGLEGSLAGLDSAEDMQTERLGAGKESEILKVIRDLIIAQGEEVTPENIQRYAQALKRANGGFWARDMMTGSAHIKAGFPFGLGNLLGE